MTYNEGIEYFKKNVCSFCCGNKCHIAQTREGFKCINYIKDVDKLNEYSETIVKEIKIKSLKHKIRNKKKEVAK